MTGKEKGLSNVEGIRKDQSTQNGSTNASYSVSALNVNWYRVVPDIFVEKSFHAKYKNGHFRTVDVSTPWH